MTVRSHWFWNNFTIFVNNIIIKAVPVMVLPILLEVIFLIQKRVESGIISIVVLFLLMFLAVTLRYYTLSKKNDDIPALYQRSVVEISADVGQGTIYDRNMMPLVNKKSSMYAVIVPEYADKNEIMSFAADKADFDEKYETGEPFVFRCDDKKIPDESEAVTVFEIPDRYEETQLAQHIIGYISDGVGVSGLEYAYDKILRGNSGENKVTYYADGTGRVLIGDGKTVQRSNIGKAGIVTTIDSRIQQICEKYGSEIDKGAIVCADAETGEILALTSFPGYSYNDLDTALNDERSPLINRALYSYGVGSIFKIVTACEGIDEGSQDYIYNCTGETEIAGQVFRCHKHDGHGIQNMTEAITESCNTYFINMSSSFDIVNYRHLAADLGFGKENFLCSGITGSAGVLPTVDELSIPAELANFSFGQGKLTATPLQITQLACAIAGEGIMPELSLIKGITLDGVTVENEKSWQKSRVIDESTAKKIKLMMISAVINNENSNARTENTNVGAKTSTAQTGRFDEDGNEYCHGWITGFFPAYKPKYVLTVLVEDGGYGNDVAAPVFKKIADEICFNS